jgi:uncharacterized membrane-anchored protein YhcB (DUF1043 family)
VEQSLTAWLLPAIALLAGLAIGFLIARQRLTGSSPHRTLQQLQELQERFDTYQNEVITHFNTTASLVSKLTQSYQDVQQHLSSGAENLALDELTRQRLLASLGSSPALPAQRDRLTPPKSNEPPRDYAPKSADEPGTLDESFGLKR